MRSRNPADAEDIVRVLGDLHEPGVATILQVRPTVAELIEARERVEQENGVPYRLGEPSARVMLLMELIRGIEEDVEAEGAEGLPREPSLAD
jgi:hypothetical protein